jgi:thioredoxin 1
MKKQILLSIAAATLLSACAVAAPGIKKVVVAETTDATFEKDVLTSKDPVFVDFYATWCGPCKAMNPVVDSLAQKYAGRVKFYRVDVDRNKVASYLGVQGLPTFAVFVEGKPVGATVGMQEAVQLESILTKVAPPQK